MSLKRKDTIITSEHLSFEHNFLRGLLVHPLKTCLCYFIRGHETYYQCTYLKVITIVRIARLHAPAQSFPFRPFSSRFVWCFSAHCFVHTSLNGKRHHSMWTLLQRKNQHQIFSLCWRVSITTTNLFAARSKVLMRFSSSSHWEPFFIQWKQLVTHSDNCACKFTSRHISYKLIPNDELRWGQ